MDSTKMFGDHDDIALSIFDIEVLRQCFERGPVALGFIASERAAKSLMNKGLVTVTSMEMKAAYCLTPAGIAVCLKRWPNYKLDWTP